MVIRNLWQWVICGGGIYRYKQLCHDKPRWNQLVAKNNFGEYVMEFYFFRQWAIYFVNKYARRRSAYNDIC